MAAVTYSFPPDWTSTAPAITYQVVNGTGATFSTNPPSEPIWYNGTTGLTFVYPYVISANCIQAAATNTHYQMFYMGTGTAAFLPCVNWRVASYDYGCYVLPTVAEQLAQILAARRAPAVRSRTQPVGHAADDREVRARETLRRVIGEARYRNFLRTGWVSVKARSGLVYQIHPGGHITEVYDRGKMVEKLCVVLDGGFTPADSLLIRLILIQSDEKFFRSKAIRSGPTMNPVHTARDDRPILEIARELRLARLAG